MRSCSLVLSLAMILLMLVTMSSSAIAACSACSAPASSCCSAPSCSAKTCHACDCNCGYETALNSMLEKLQQMVENQRALLVKMTSMHDTLEVIKAKQ